MMELLLRLGYIVLVYKKDKSCINSSGKGVYIIVCYLVIGENEEVEVKQSREVLIFEGTGSRSWNHCGINV